MCRAPAPSVDPLGGSQDKAERVMVGIEHKSSSAIVLPAARSGWRSHDGHRVPHQHGIGQQAQTTGLVYDLLVVAPSGTRRGWRRPPTADGMTSLHGNGPPWSWAHINVDPDEASLTAPEFGIASFMLWFSFGFETLQFHIPSLFSHILLGVMRERTSVGRQAGHVTGIHFGRYVRLNPEQTMIGSPSKSTRATLSRRSPTPSTFTPQSSIGSQR
jgi:hypothetical protein